MVVMERAQVPVASSLAKLHRRLAELGYESVADTAGETLLSMIADQRLGVASVELIADTLQQGYWAYPQDWYVVVNENWTLV